MKKENENVKKVEELLTKIPKDKYEDIVKAASKAETADDIKAIAAEYQVEITDEQAALLLKMYSEELSLPQDFLAGVSGGAASEDMYSGGSDC